MFISIKTTSLHEANSTAERIRNSGTEFFCMPCWDFWYTRAPRHKKRAPCDTFFQKQETNRVPEMSPNYLQNMAIQGNKALNLFLLRVLLHNRFCAQYLRSLKGCLVDDTNMPKRFSTMNLRIICIKPFTCNHNNKTFSGHSF